MKQVDYSIVGCGLASIAFCEQLRAHNKSFVVFDDASQQSSIVAAGLYNPVILKRFTPVWKAKEQLALALPTYKAIEDNLSIKIDHRLRILRRFASVEEQNLWFSALDKPLLEPYLKPQLIKTSPATINAPFGFGEVLHAGWLDTELLIKIYKQNLQNNNQLLNETFDYNAISFSNDAVQYKDVVSQHIVFAEGFGLKHNPYFSHLPLNGTKGEVLTIKAADLKIDYAIKASVFIIPKGNGVFTVGSTYNWDDKTNLPTENGKAELLSKLRTFVTCDVEVIDHVAGIRPTVKDRRPLVGQHHEHKQLFVLNGLGTRGVMLAPYVAQQLYQFIEHKRPLQDEITIERF